MHATDCCSSQGKGAGELGRVDAHALSWRLFKWYGSPHFAARQVEDAAIVPRSAMPVQGRRRAAYGSLWWRERDSFFALPRKLNKPDIFSETPRQTRVLWALATCWIVSISIALQQVQKSKYILTSTIQHHKTLFFEIFIQLFLDRIPSGFTLGKIARDRLANCTGAWGVIVKDRFAVILKS